jgi:hypothetical protein
VRNAIGSVLIVMGALVILAPVVTTACSKWANQDHIAEFYGHNGYSIPMPEAMRPGNGTYDWACLFAGAGMVVAGALTGRFCAMTPEEKHIPSAH